MCIRDSSSDAYNNKLSQNRAQSAVDYIVLKGIEKDRLVAKGYGETRLIIKKAQTEEEHQKNRRTAVSYTHLDVYKRQDWGRTCLFFAERPD